MDAGCTAQEVVTKLEEARERIRLMAVVDTLEFLQRGGRLSKTAAIAGGILSIKPIIALVDGQIKVLAKGRGNKQANALMTQQIVEAGIDETMPMMLGFTGCSRELLEKYRAQTEIWTGDVYGNIVSGVVGAHVGPGAVAVAFFAK